ncbi:T9SS type A sorting domain-containing protein [bacterium]|nr:T9SS type A sorting domain-containing protein [bacterium]
MRKLLLILTAVLVIMPTAAFAADDSYFPLDQGMIWAYDDQNVDHVDSFTKIAVPEQRTVLAYTMKYFQSEKVTYFRIGKKVYEWRNGYYRMWYDFGSSAGDSWKLEWRSATAQKEDPGNTTGKNRPNVNVSDIGNDDESLDDINKDAEITLLETGLDVETPMGKFSDVYHFITKRPGVADAGYVEEWFAPGVGCVMRKWDTIAGPQMHQLVKATFPEEAPQPVFYRMDVKLDKSFYVEGENIVIEVTVLNWSDKEVKLDFPSSLQVDYTIDNDYRWSSDRAFTQELTSVTIAARDTYKWTFTHTPEDFKVATGKHIITAELVGTNIRAYQSFLVIESLPVLPEGIELTVATGKDTYSMGEIIDFTVTASNTTQSDITLNIVDFLPIKYMIDTLNTEYELLFSRPLTKKEVVVPAGGSVTYEGTHSPDILTYKPGEHILYAGLTGYSIYAKTTFTISQDLAYGTLAGTVTTPATAITVSNNQQYNPVEGAEIYLKPVIPKMRENDVNFMPSTSQQSWSATTGSDGAFTIADVPIGMYFILSVYKDGYYPYNETIRFLGEKNLLSIVLKPKKNVPDQPVVFNRQLVEGLVISFGTDATVYKPDSPFKAFLGILNTRKEAVTFTFDNEDYVNWAILGSNEEVLWSSSEKAGKSSAEFTVTIEPGEGRVFTHEGTFADVVPDKGGKYIVKGILAFTSCSIETIKSGYIGGLVRVLVVPSTSERIQAQARNREMVVEVKGTFNAEIDLSMKDDNVSGEILVSEVLENPHKQLNKHQFLKMIEIDADSTIRAGMDSALVRIYYGDMEKENPDFDPLKLRIAHWKDNPNWTPLNIDPTKDNPLDALGGLLSDSEWEMLQGRIDTINKYIEAYTNSFSSFGLFEYDESVTGVEEQGQIPESLVLKQNQPNPFNPATLIQFSLPQAGTVQVVVYNIMGQEIARLVDGFLPAGAHNVVFDGSRFSSGVYFYSVRGAGFSATRKMLLLK